MEGTAARQAVAVPKNPSRTRERVSERDTEQNRSRALSVGRGYVLFLTVMAVACLFMCVHYVQMKQMVIAQTESNARLQSQLTALQSENDALEETITDSIDWDYVKDTAINELGMQYATEDQVIWYSIQDNGYVRQYQSVDDGE
ncbi:MAG: hypothetical protein KBS83_07305 [Lachnospiraceae bacterium]|nr:hypothetical protein [Candidatus Equihabitans merdae]